MKKHKGTKAKAQGKPPGDSGVNKSVRKESVPLKVAKDRYSSPKQKQKM